VGHHGALVVVDAEHVDRRRDQGKVRGCHLGHALAVERPQVVGVAAPGDGIGEPAVHVAVEARRGSLVGFRVAFGVDRHEIERNADRRAALCPERLHREPVGDEQVV
jgi:hypothetical protein